MTAELPRKAVKRRNAPVPVDDAESERPAGQADYDMANLRPARTGPPFVVFVSQKGGARHDIRIKLARAAKIRASEMITVAVRPAPRVVRGSISAGEFALVSRWIELNRQVLTDYCDGTIEYTGDLLDAIKPMDNAG
ncbi:MAG TPA: hypothetical protein VME41_10455 [Stellaceae bacterium]|nr:hypothetical protein [Stellaceae bacterium]